jgi:hypothetical protein
MHVTVTQLVSSSALSTADNMARPAGIFGTSKVYEVPDEIRSVAAAMAWFRTFKPIERTDHFRVEVGGGPETRVYDTYDLSPKADAGDTLARIATAFKALNLTCSCGDGAACDVCEIHHLIEEAFPNDDEG